MHFNLPFLSRATETHNKLRVSPKWSEQQPRKEREREWIAERKMSELFVNWREHLADSFTNIWQSHLFVCQSPWLMLQYGADSTPWEFGCCLDRRGKTWNTCLVKNPHYDPENVKPKNQWCVFSLKGYVFFSPPFFLFTIFCWVTKATLLSPDEQLISLVQGKCSKVHAENRTEFHRNKTLPFVW